MYYKFFTENIMDALKKFRKANSITQSELGDYLGIKKSFISSIENMRAKLPEDKFTKLLNNDKGWDISMFSQESSPTSNSGVYINGNNRINHSPIDNRQYYSDSPDVLRAQIEILDERIKEKDAQIKEKDAQIKQLLEILAKR